MSKLKTIFKDKHKGRNEVSGVGGILTCLLRKLWEVENTSYDKFTTLLDRYVDRMPDNGSKEAKQKKSSKKGNVIKAIVGPHMTWRSFIELLQIHRVIRIDIAIHVVFTAYSRNIGLSVDLEKLPIDDELDGVPPDQEPK